MLSRQQSSTLTTVVIDFKPMPKVPTMTIAQDQEAMAKYSAEMQAWYENLKTSLLDKLNALQAQINTLKKGQ